jgi:hypothetical protein
LNPTTFGIMIFQILYYGDHEIKEMIRVESTNEDEGFKKDI